MKIDAAKLPVFFVAVDHQCRVIEWNPKAAEIIGISKADALERDIGDCLNILTNPNAELSQEMGIKSLIIDVLHNDALSSHEVLASVVGGGYNLLLTISALYDECNSLLGAMVVGQDIKQYEILERNRVAGGHEIRKLFEKSTSLIIGIDSSGLINVWSIQMKEVIGYSTDECIGRHFVQV
jgi:PAS domain-containing protein